MKNITDIINHIKDTWDNLKPDEEMEPDDFFDMLRQQITELVESCPMKSKSNKKEWIELDIAIKKWKREVKK